jgi:hypothetical protein
MRSEAETDGIASVVFDFYAAGEQLYCQCLELAAVMA